MNQPLNPMDAAEALYDAADIAWMIGLDEEKFLYQARRAYQVVGEALQRQKERERAGLNDCLCQSCDKPRDGFFTARGLYCRQCWEAIHWRQPEGESQ